MLEVLCILEGLEDESVGVFPFPGTERYEAGFFLLS